MDSDYSNRELDLKFERVHEKLDDIIVKVTYTNGKVRKIIIALVLLAGIVIGQSFTNTHDIIELLVHML
jgi:tetrahydromethanopterin S-methyltransferase subunit G